MKNLKRILSLALASVMVMGMMVVGASAAEFNDQDEINPVNVNAVNTMVSLKIISGKEGNQFDPKGDVTRAEMATMIAMALNGGDKDFRGTTTTGFTDVDGIASIKWAAKFIKYCVDQGILSGVGGGKFNPNANVTAQEAATMVLTAMGYKKEMLKSETSDWAAKINLKAEQRDLYDDTAVTDYTETINRETAAQMIYNGITVGTPTITDQYNTTTGEHIYGVADEAGKPSILTSSSYNNGKFTYTMSTTGVEVAPLGGSEGVDDIQIASELDVTDLFQQKVKVIYSDSSDTVNTNSTIIGINKTGDCVLGTGVLGKINIKSDKKTIDGKNITPAALSSVKTYEFNTAEKGTAESKATIAAGNAWDEYKLIDNNNDGRVDCIVVYPVLVRTVSAVGNTTVTIGGISPALKKDENTIDDVKVGDWVMVKDGVTGQGKTVTKMTAIENVTATVKSTTAVYTVGGEKYSFAAGATDTINGKLGKAFDLIALNGYIFNAKEVTESAASAGVEDVVYTVAVADAAVQAKDKLGNNIPGKFTQDVEVMYAKDGTSAILSIMTVDGTAIPDTTAVVTTDTLYTLKTEDDGSYMSMGLWGRQKGVWYRVEEFYYDSRKEGRQKTDREYAGDLAALAGGRAISRVVVDPSAASFLACLREEGWPAAAGDNDVLRGIRVTADLLRRGRLVICEPCRDAIREFSLYRWDERAGRDRVVKRNDHAMDEIRYFAMGLEENRYIGGWGVTRKV